MDEIKARENIQKKRLMEINEVMSRIEKKKKENERLRELMIRQDEMRQQKLRHEKENSCLNSEVCF